MAVDSKDNVFCFTRGEHPGHRLRPRRDASSARGARALVRRAHAITIDADDMVWLTDDLHHTVRKFTPDGQAPAHHRQPRQARAAAGRQAVQPPHPRGDLPEDRLPLRLRRLRQLARAQVRAGRAPRHVLGRARHRSGPVQPAPQSRHRRRRAGLRRRPREPPRADLRRRGPLPGPVEQPAPALRALRRPPQRRSLLRRRARLRHAGHRARRRTSARA